ncbi:hypothetical protein [Paenibacillus camerounensis]|uniref:hypothetical protein n=1 Tax=Paenibacillus camerounensis TaxID=1243663 RepID=UPI0005AB2232|nr:hypothetical protein [Paenibacillus camerounensis]
MSSFWSLVQNDRLLGDKSNRKPAYLWISALLLLLFFTWYTVVLLYGTAIAPLNLLKITPLFIFVFAGVSIRLSIKEWRKQTISWWLMLPFPRYYLLCAKALSALIICFKILLLCYAITLATGLESYWLSPELFNNRHSLGNYFYEVNMNYFGYLILSPLIISITITLVMLFKSRLRFFVLLIIMLASPLLSLVFSDHNIISKNPNLSFKLSFQLPEYISSDYLSSYLPITLLVSLLVSAMLLFVSSLILEKKIQI